MASSSSQEIPKKARVVSMLSFSRNADSTAFTVHILHELFRLNPAIRYLVLELSGISFSTAVEKRRDVLATVLNKQVEELNKQDELLMSTGFFQVLTPRKTTTTTLVGLDDEIQKYHKDPDHYEPGKGNQIALSVSGFVIKNLGNCVTYKSSKDTMRQLSAMNKQASMLGDFIQKLARVNECQCVIVKWSPTSDFDIEPLCDGHVIFHGSEIKPVEASFRVNIDVGDPEYNKQASMYLYHSKCFSRYENLKKPLIRCICHIPTDSTNKMPEPNSKRLDDLYQSKRYLFYNKIGINFADVHKQLCPLNVGHNTKIGNICNSIIDLSSAIPEESKADQGNHPPSESPKEITSDPTPNVVGASESNVETIAASPLFNDLFGEGNNPPQPDEDLGCLEYPKIDEESKLHEQYVVDDEQDTSNALGGNSQPTASPGRNQTESKDLSTAKPTRLHGQKRTEREESRTMSPKSGCQKKPCKELSRMLSPSLFDIESRCKGIKKSDGQRPTEEWIEDFYDYDDGFVVPCEKDPDVVETSDSESSDYEESDDEDSDNDEDPDYNTENGDEDDSDEEIAEISDSDYEEETAKETDDEDNNSDPKVSSSEEEAEVEEEEDDPFPEYCNCKCLFTKVDKWYKENVEVSHDKTVITEAVKNLTDIIVATFNTNPATHSYQPTMSAMALLKVEVGKKHLLSMSSIHDIIVSTRSNLNTTIDHKSNFKYSFRESNLRKFRNPVVLIKKDAPPLDFDFIDCEHSRWIQKDFVVGKTYRINTLYAFKSHRKIFNIFVSWLKYMSQASRSLTFIPSEDRGGHNESRFIIHEDRENRVYHLDLLADFYQFRSLYNGPETASKKSPGLRLIFEFFVSVADQRSNNQHSSTLLTFYGSNLWTARLNQILNLKKECESLTGDKQFRLNLIPSLPGHPLSIEHSDTHSPSTSSSSNYYPVNRFGKRVICINGQEVTVESSEQPKEVVRLEPTPTPVTPTPEKQGTEKTTRTLLSRRLRPSELSDSSNSNSPR
jgi:hypothetical protein